jgi:cell surface protein SprA
MILFKKLKWEMGMPLNSSLIRGAQSLFGVKPNCNLENNRYRCFFRTKSQQKSVVAQGGGTTKILICLLWTMIVIGTFLSQYFRNKYDASLKNYPFIDSRVQISRLEIWVTNKTSSKYYF